MEDVHGAHKERTTGWVSALIGAAARLGRQARAESQGYVVTPWSGRSPNGWSA